MDNRRRKEGTVGACKTYILESPDNLMNRVKPPLLSPTFISRGELE